MAVDPLTSIKSNRYGRVRYVTGLVTTGGTSGDIKTGLGRVLDANFGGIASADTDISVARNTLTTTDEAREALGTVHYAGANSGSSYLFRAKGF